MSGLSEFRVLRRVRAGDGGCVSPGGYGRGKVW